ncbi:tetratricopeptide repeat protein [Mycolicibacterium vanbaalenii]|jgi:tetratricopeptide (TPR) repeat protein|uniref:Tetratricopeptide TPR_2 repeat protein n=1 Tax=Mycolicibacterium vanbaalenii (strain DSM 7251 / JCM 13017 / BCRC 16820 / KCTC 9966 / NRRL B-24157 / PYR-1) TaxID=350058 RepID=A1T9K9_MYCVP|nr:tetratricopeptide repeat protein [Mycolicibacterium vanbaalenii]ABM13859.1 Tetratricopeptide TPR_2 repeat protein [Mycolicibacterium vanbaalenii PYR-1]MCV7128568.1 tetratricopeptide repeat protein [Mycolicibacterium vanbaalenii PYR-1]UJL27534.1 tetratricopeptide repeat protein [Mycolicibacterium vanbaalenii]WND54215.1 tetratricopeptide repeat protein [Mycolicibacterium vanbaalenii]
MSVASGSTEPYYDLGSFHRPTDTASDAAQVWFDRGMVWAYAFNHEEAIHCFERALELDADLAMARWGIAYAIGPNYNKGREAFDPVDLAASVARAKMELGLAAAGRASAVERGLIDALARRFTTDDPADARTLQAGHTAYADAMSELARAYPDDVDVAALAADALVNVTAWALWDSRTGEPAPGSRVVEAKRILDDALATPAGRAHPGILHLYLHTMEMSTTPEAALPAADLLRGLVPDAGHLRHMPSHIDVLCGNYRDSIVANLAAVQVDRHFVERQGPLNFYSLYRAHNLHFVVYSAMFEGNSAIALRAADELSGQLTPELLAIESPPMADWLEAFVPLRVHVLVRFGRWDELIATPLPDDPQLYCTTTATIHYGRGVAHAASGHLDQAAAERELFAAAYDRIPDSRYLFNNTSRDILAVAAAMLDGEIDYRAGRFDDAFAHLRRAVELDDTLPYDEPWGWMQPTRHALGALLLEQGRVEEAAQVYAADLGLDPTLSRSCQHPGNVWSLHGYHECLTRLGRGPEALIIGKQLELAAARADVPIEASCACRLQPHCCD